MLDMKMLITSTGNSLDSKLDLRFGRAAWFCVYNTESNKTEFLENENLNAQGGAGTKTAEKVAELGINRVVSGDFGPKAKSLLERFKIQMIIMNEDNKTIQEIIDKIQN
jgi:predicted Fe-Mo cluster-binding NifX family protein